MSNDVMSSHRGELFILSAPSAVGKTTLKNEVFTRHQQLAEGLAYSVSHTSRPARAGEVEGRDYYFVDHRQFETLIAGDAFLEWAIVHGNLYGTRRVEVERLLDGGRDVLLDIDVQGAQQVLARHPDAPAIFILPPSYGEMERRLRCRGLDDAEQIERRLLDAREEMQYLESYRYVIVNDDLDRAAEALAAILLARRCRRRRMQRQITQVLEGFPAPARKPPSGS